MTIEVRNKLNQFNNIAPVANNDLLQRVTKFKYLGVTINQYVAYMSILTNYNVKLRLGVLKRFKHLHSVYARKICHRNGHPHTLTCKYRMG